ncbi:MAG TPA: hypothetical protein PLP05_01470 [Sedimentisphaerales bacterium]|nr:hypothetical protein [Sedimentisphaerales bacterium]
MKKITIFTFLTLVLFLSATKMGIELNQNGFSYASFCFITASHILKLVFLVALVWFMYKGVSLFDETIVLQIFLGILCFPFFFISCAGTLISGREILNLSRPTRPDAFIEDQSSVQKLTDLANEMIKRKTVFWIGNGLGFIFSIRYEDGDYQFDSRLIPQDCDFNEPVAAEDMSKMNHPDLPFQSSALKPTDQKILDPNDYAFCKRASSIIRKIGFDNIKLYHDHNVVQYQIYDFIGWDNGGYYVYYFCPNTTLPEEFKYEKKLNDNWYYIREPRFKK